MEIHDHINYWLKSAEHDLHTAELLFKNEHFDWCLFLGHLTIEKVLKAFYVRDNQNQVPPFTHNLAMIAERTRLELSPEQQALLLELNQFNLQSRYPDYKFEFYKKCTSPFAATYFTKIKGMYQWLLQQI